MGWLGRLFGQDPESKVNKARLLLDQGRYVDVRWLLEGVEHVDAQPLLKQARDGLVLLNLDEARARQSAGDSEGADLHMEMAKEFGATAEDLQALRRVARESRMAQRVQASQEVETPTAEGDDPLWQLDPSDPKLQYALKIEGYPAILRERLVALGSEFAQAVMKIEGGDPEGAFRDIGRFVEQDPVSRYERSRAALAVNKLPAAASDLMTFGDKVGHCLIGQQHTLALLAQVLGRLGRLDEALSAVEAELQGPTSEWDLRVAVPRASILLALGRFADAEKATEQLLLRAGRDMGLYRLLGKARLEQGNRLGAMQALEGGLTKLCSSPGKCGNQNFDVEAGRLLVRLYLEDRIEPKRVDELLAELRRAVRKPTWTDHYISALVARNAGDPASSALAERLLQGLKPGDPRAEMVEQALLAVTSVDTRPAAEAAEA